MGHLPPVMRLALAFAVGATWVLAGAPLGMAPLAALAFFAWPNHASRLPPLRRLWITAAIGGLAAAGAGSPPIWCGPVAEDEETVIEGRFLATPRGGSGPFLPASGCGAFTVVLPDSTAPAGRPLSLVGSWREGGRGPWFLARALRAQDDTRSKREWRWLTVRWRDHLVVRLQRLYGDHAPLVTALTLARREGLNPELRETFARVGIAHLLAISGFHVGVIAGVVLVLLRSLGQGRRSAAVGAAAAAWIYVGLIGFPDAACRAALLLALVALSTARGRPPARWGALGAALLVLLALEPGRLLTPGFQLSFAGAAGLVAWSGALSAAIQRLCRGRCPKELATGIAAGVAATAATLPVVAWHFERVSLVGIPVTLAATPLVALALTGSLASLVVDFFWPDLASFLAGGVGSVVWLLEAGAEVVSTWPWASAWTTRNTVIGGTLGLLVAVHLARRPRLRAPTRRALAALYVTTGVLSWPVLLTWQGRGSIEIQMIDVGQGDAIALRSPRGRWLLVDAGPAVRAADPLAHPVVRALRSRGVRRLEALVLTHPDLDHIGGAEPVLSAFEVGVVYDPARPAPKRQFVDVLDAAASSGVPWRAARAGDRIEVDGLVISVLHPTDSLGAGVESNATSVVLRVSYGEFDALLTGDADKDVERMLEPASLEGIEILKVGHHGSDTSTDSSLLALARPEVALISVGRNNGYGHPSPAVLGRLERNGVRVRRTDREGTLSVLARRDGSYSVTAEHGASATARR